MRTDLLEQIASQVSRYNVRQQVDYDYETARQRMIFEALTQGVQYVCNNGVDGDIAEFGTALGFSALTIARAMAFYQQMYARALKGHGVTDRRALHLFDSFQGLPAPEHPVDRDSANVKSGHWKQGSYVGLNPQELGALCASTYDANRLRIVPGWFKDSLPTIPPQTRFAMVHLDCDLYSSTAEVLEHVFANRLLAEGAVLFFDDWNCNRSSPQQGQRRAWREAVERHRIEYSDCGDYAVLSHKFIIHASK